MASKKLIYTNTTGQEQGYLVFNKFDIDINGSQDFQIEQPYESWNDDLVNGCRVFVPETEYGGVVGGFESDSNLSIIATTGRSWRGMLTKKIVMPWSDANTLTGDVNTAIGYLLERCTITPLYRPVDGVGASVSVQIDRHCTLYDALIKVVQSIGCRLSLVYKQQEYGEAGYVEVSAVSAQALTDQVDVSSNYGVNFTAKAVYNGINHLVCLGQGELSARTVIHLYVDANGNISDTQTFTGADEIAEVYANSNASADELRADGIKRLNEVMNNTAFDVQPSEINLEAHIGDIIGGTDYITGLSVQKPIANIIYTIEGDVERREYKLEE